MLSAEVELALSDITRRLNLLIDQVDQGDPVDDDLLRTLNKVSAECFLKYVKGEGITEQDLQIMIDLLSILELRTTLIYKNPPN